MKKSILFIVGISINFFLANFSNLTVSEQTYVWKGKIVSGFIESSANLDFNNFNTVDLLEDFGDYVVTECTYVSGSTYDMPPLNDGQSVLRVCNGSNPCEIRVVLEISQGLKGSCYFFPN